MYLMILVSLNNFFFSSIFKLGKIVCIVCVLGMINMRTYWDNQCCAFKVAFGSLCHYGKISKALVLNKLHQLDIWGLDEMHAKYFNKVGIIYILTFL